MITVGNVTATTSNYEDWNTFEVHFDDFEKLPATKSSLAGTPFVAEEVFSPVYTCFGHEWRLSICPGGGRVSADGMVAVFLSNMSNKSIKIQYGFAIKDREGNTKKECVCNDFGLIIRDKEAYTKLEYEGIRFFENGHENDNYGLDLCKRSYIIENLVDGKLIIEVRMRQTKATEKDGGKGRATILSKADKQSAQQSAHKNNKDNSADDNPEHPPLKKMRT